MAVLVAGEAAEAFETAAICATSLAVEQLWGSLHGLSLAWADQEEAKGVVWRAATAITTRRLFQNSKKLLFIIGENSIVILLLATATGNSLTPTDLLPDFKLVMTKR